MSLKGMLFRDRAHAAGLLADRLAPYRGTRPLVLGVSPGAVLMARDIAEALGGDVDVPGHADPSGRTVVLVAERLSREIELPRGAARVVLAAAVGTPGPLSALRDRTDETICLACPAYFGSLSRYFMDLPEPPEGEARAAR